MILLLFFGQYVLEKINLPDNTESNVKRFVSETHGVIDLPYYVELHLTLRKVQYISRLWEMISWLIW